MIPKLSDFKALGGKWKHFFFSLMTQLFLIFWLKDHVLFL